MADNASVTEFIPLSKPNLSDKDISLVTEVLKSGMLVQGPYVSEMEKKVSKLTNTPYASALSNGTATLHLALKILNIGPGDEVIVPAFSYVATANVVELVGARPVFVDIDITTFNIKIELIEKVINARTKAIIPVHEFGLSCDIAGVMSIARKYNLFVIEDAACALGAKFGSQHVGSFGHFGSFSLHPRKAITSGEGGVLITHDEMYDSKVRILRNHGVESIGGKMEFTEFGYNYRMTDFQAALIISQFDGLEAGIRHKNELADIYFTGLNTKKMSLPFVPYYTAHTWQTYHVVLNDDTDRDALIGKLREKGIGVNYGAQCIPETKAYKAKYNYDCEKLFPNALCAYKHGLALPIYDLLTKDQTHYIVETLNQMTS